MSETAIEITVLVNGIEDQKFKKKFLIYEVATMSLEDPVIKSCIDLAVSECKFDIEDIRVKASF